MDATMTRSELLSYFTESVAQKHNEFRALIGANQTVAGEVYDRGQSSSNLRDL